MDLTNKTVPYALVKTEVRARHKDEIVVGKTAHYWADEKDPDSLCSVRSEIVLTLAEAVAVADEMNRLLSGMLAPDAEYEAWLESKAMKYGVGPLDVEDPASRFAADEPLPATDAEYAERQIERGAP